MANRWNFVRTRLLGYASNQGSLPIDDSRASSVAPSGTATVATISTNDINVNTPASDGPDQLQDQRFLLAVLMTGTAVLLPVFASISNTIVKDWLIVLDASSWAVSTTFVFLHNHHLSRSRLFRNVVVAILAFTFFVWSFQATLPYAFVWLPLAVDVAVVVNAQEPPWVCLRPHRQYEVILPTHHARQ